ncbi:hypothetical protein LINGRAHAP2_LOCUS8727 [Linum grandiflorum]
MPKQSHLARY